MNILEKMMMIGITGYDRICFSGTNDRPADAACFVLSDWKAIEVNAVMRADQVKFTVSVPNELWLWILVV